MSNKIEIKVLELLSLLDLEGDETTEELYASLDRYIANLKRAEKISLSHGDECIE